MPVDFRAYTDPGVYIEEIPYPVVTSPTISPTVMAVIGDSQRYRAFTESLQLTGTTAYQLTKLGINTTSIKVTDRYTGSTYVLNTDFTVAAQAGADGSLNTQDDTTTVSRVSNGGIADGTYVTIKYNYTDPDYYKTYRFVDYDDVREFFGEPFDTAGAINSEVTLAALLAFRNGGDEIVCKSVKAAGATPTTTEWQDAFSDLLSEPGIHVVVPIDGNTAIHDIAYQHCVQAAGLTLLRRTFIGRDGTLLEVTASALQTQAQGYRHTRVTLVAPSVFEFYNGTNLIQLGGQYAAAAAAGAHSSRPPQEPLTRKPIRSFYSIPNQGTNQEILNMQRNGLCVLFQKRDGGIIVKHGLTTDMTDVYKREINVQAAKDRLIDLLEDTLEESDLIGGMLTHETPDFVIGEVTGCLDVAVQHDLIFDYTDLKWRIQVENPTVMEVRFQYRPTLPLNYIQIMFAINTDTGSLEFSQEQSLMG